MNIPTNRTLTAALTLALAVGLTACGSGDDGTDGAGVEATTPVEATTDDTATAEDTSADGTATGGAAGDLTATALTAVATAEDEAGGTAYEIDDQDDDGSWEVDVAVGDRSVEVTVSEDGLTVVGTEDDDLDDDDRTAVEAAGTTLADAIETAVTEVGGTLDDAELEEEDGAWLWKVTVDGADSGDDDVDVLVDVSSGEVVSTDG
ncbi:PepSY domain-containing protein [Ornithinimicrobium pekingense]|nr:PepSY domain-containing protein [Ornithinimicrobium pekingense]